jgi:serine/threonine protein kinase
MEESLKDLNVLSINNKEMPLETQAEPITKIELCDCPLDYKYLTHGGYGDIYYNSNSNTILKVQPLYSLPESNILYESSLSEAIITQSLSKINNIAQFDKIEIDKNKTNIYYYMPYYGTPLDKILNKEKIIENIVPILLSLVETCYQLYLNGIQHTDIKPSNIIISDDFQKITLIDLNIFSIKSSSNNLYGWTYGIGTWCYCEPSIIYNDEPTETAMVWSIAFIIAYIYGNHPLLEYYPYLYKYEKNNWIQIYNNLRKRFRQGIPLTKTHTSVMSAELYYIFNISTQWEWTKRPTMSNLYDMIVNNYAKNTGYIKIERALKYYNYKNVTIHHDKQDRIETFNTILQLCKITSKMDILCRILILIDLYSNDHTDESIIGCIYIAHIISGYTLTDKNFNKLVNKFYNENIITYKVLSNILLHTLETFQWNCYFQTPDTLIIDYIIQNVRNTDSTKNYKDCDEYVIMDKLYGSYKFYKLLYTIIKIQENEYNIYDITEIVFKDIKQLIE